MGKWQNGRFGDVVVVPTRSLPSDAVCVVNGEFSRIHAEFSFRFWALPLKADAGWAVGVVCKCYEGCSFCVHFS